MTGAPRIRPFRIDTPQARLDDLGPGPGDTFRPCGNGL
ncbi:hypothetical protein Sros_2157 [Streptosporangium roseum DSM 43021]|uniref:Uncharacterized protein n=1 Tax=Streptosporangium roseum (strain ATCC 12428 / DSM 43021 / JCM 3005 / KCTC 9067 / NCIMB 10171 / NRRL 2505 / NI 9100) TaxID=479432 RepID=D2AXW9_STRRD|nr:hypothetical protein Sros_2157 [Streptosporangium roseum DSM 43021]